MHTQSSGSNRSANPCLFLLIMLLSFSAIASGQEMKMHQMHANEQNIYLKMMDAMMNKMEPAAKEHLLTINFLKQMIPHHEGAIEMAKYEVQHGKDFSMIQLAKSIEAEQNIEVQQMKLLLKKTPTDTAKRTAGYNLLMHESMETMMHNMPPNAILKNTDEAFARVMIPHHRAAVDMAKAVIRFTKDTEVIAIAKYIISTQQVEIEQMSSFLKN
jgi:uncharacterized protein (DUF305 family)